MAEKIKNKNFNKAQNSKNDEFYTQLTDIERELKHYKKHFKDKVVYCNCDDPRVSNQPYPSFSTRGLWFVVCNDNHPLD